MNGCPHAGEAVGMVPYLVHEPSLILWYRANADTLTGMKNVWVVEQDALFGGSLVTFLAMHARLSADLITVFCPFTDVAGTCVDAHSASMMPMRTTNMPNDTRVVDNRDPENPDVVHQWEHVVRFSRSLIEGLESALDSGYVRHGEEFAPSFCVVNQSSWCTTLDLRETLSASAAVGTAKLNDPPLPHAARWYHTEEQHRCQMLIDWSAARGDVNMTQRIREQCTQPAPGNVPSRVAEPIVASSALLPMSRLVNRFDCNNPCCGRGLDWCCPTAVDAHRNGTRKARTHARSSGVADDWRAKARLLAL